MIIHYKILRVSVGNNSYSTLSVIAKEAYPENKLMQNKGYINVKRGLNSAPPRTQFNYSIIIEMKCKIIDINIRLNYLFFAVQDPDNLSLRFVADHNTDFQLTITEQYSF